MPFDSPNLPPPVDFDVNVVETCVNYSAQHFNINTNVIKAIILTEGGKLGTLSKNTNGTYDMGIMQINTMHLDRIYKEFNITWDQITYSPCINIGIGAWILDQALKSTSNFWLGVGRYHSNTPKYRDRYLKRVYYNYNRLLKNNGKLEGLL